jgi:2-polyprenyl-3-methyl-5-hydroxy-6-metoxy-1,4-benzoquinol methylase
MLAAVHLEESATPLEKYVFKPSLGSSHAWAVNHIKELAEGKRVLDIGAGGGAMGRAARECGATKTVAIEIDATTRGAISPLYDAVYPDISTMRAHERIPARFDLILLLDVLEHMVDPFEVMESISDLLTPGGVALISVPNVAHWSVRLPLLFGRFEYASRGLLDKTHLHFFTRQRVRSLLSKAPQCKTIEESSSIEPIELVLPKRITNTGVFRCAAKLRLLVARALPGLMAYQHLGAIRHTPSKGVYTAHD